MAEQGLDAAVGSRRVGVLVWALLGSQWGPGLLLVGVAGIVLTAVVGRQEASARP